MKKILIILAISISLISCKTNEANLKQTEKAEKQVVKVEEKKEPVEKKEIQKKRKIRFKQNVKKLKVDVEMPYALLTWDLGENSEVDKINIYRRKAKGKFEKIQSLEANLKESKIEVDGTETVFKVRLLSKDGRESSGRNIQPSFIAVSRDSFFDEEL